MMPAHTKPFDPRCNRGFTIIETMVVVAIVAIIAAITIPNLSGIMISKGLNDSQESIAAALRKAKTTAHSKNKRVVVTFTNNGTTFSVTPAGEATQVIGLGNTTTTAANAITFNPMGLVDGFAAAIDITTQANADNAQTRTVRVENLFGQLNLL